MVMTLTEDTGVVPSTEDIDIPGIVDTNDDFGISGVTSDIDPNVDSDVADATCGVEFIEESCVTGVACRVDPNEDSDVIDVASDVNTDGTDEAVLRDIAVDVFDKMAVVVVKGARCVDTDPTVVIGIDAAGAVGRDIGGIEDKIAVDAIDKVCVGVIDRVFVIGVDRGVDVDRIDVDIDADVDRRVGVAVTDVISVPNRGTVEVMVRDAVGDIDKVFVGVTDREVVDVGRRTGVVDRNAVVVVVVVVDTYVVDTDIAGILDRDAD
ncbi:hypothetical protein SK128_020191 [Halocaridina rubra]|uniref:Uncharacterized protein n=1 Tax=Halocaridina rubra TaxID=373956 RepID=A0AAN8X998_HALRR